MHVFILLMCHSIPFILFRAMYASSFRPHKCLIEEHILSYSNTIVSYKWLIVPCAMFVSPLFRLAKNIRLVSLLLFGIYVLWLYRHTFGSSILVHNNGSTHCGMNTLNIYCVLYWERIQTEWHKPYTVIINISMKI